MKAIALWFLLTVANDGSINTMPIGMEKDVCIRMRLSLMVNHQTVTFYCVNPTTGEVMP